MHLSFPASRRVGFYFTAALALLLVLQGCENKKDDDKPVANDAIPVEAVKAARRPMTANYSGTATLEPEAEADVVGKTSGILLKLLVEEGDKVKAGQALARLDSENARLNLAKSAATLGKLESDYRRSGEMFSRKLLSAEQNDKIRYDLETQRAINDLAKLELSYSTVTAPISGIISRRLVKEGNYIQLNEILFRIDNFDPLLAVLNVPERELHTLSADQPVSLQVDALPGTSFKGVIQRISPVVDAGTGTFRVTCEFRDDSNRLKSGMFARLEITYGERADALTVPQPALIEEDGEAAVFVVVPGSSVTPPVKDDDVASTKKKTSSIDEKSQADVGDKAIKKAPEWVAQRRSVKVGFRNSDYVEILDGLNEGDRVVTVGRSAVRDGTAIQVLEGVQ
ncbi:MAG: efflux RND transporter periplasmic adaptor subunit [Dokdonella sp.]